MRVPSIGELLVAWERAYAQSPAERAVTLLQSVEDEDIVSLPLGERDARLLALREATFGTLLEAQATCAACGERMEARVATSDFRAPNQPGEGPSSIEVGEYRASWRLPTSGDLASLQPADGMEVARARLEELCITEAWHGIAPISAHALPSEVRDALAQAIAEADPRLDVELSMSCPGCGHENAIPFDVTTYFWDELNVWAQRTLREVHALAAAYGWSERDILSMTGFRRQAYLEMIGA